MKLSEYFTLEELTTSQYAARNNLSNIPGGEILENLKKTAQKMDHVRRLLGHPVIVSSGYRSPEVNNAVGGSNTSDHMNGLSVDFICPAFGNVESIVDKIDKSGVEFDQLINEFGKWVHIGFGSKMRRQVKRFD